MPELNETAERELISTTFRCRSCRHKGVYGADYTEQVGPLPDECTECGEPWGAGEARYAEEGSDG
jgi:hypothetical protein